MPKAFNSFESAELIVDALLDSHIDDGVPIDYPNARLLVAAAREYPQLRHEVQQCLATEGQLPDIRSVRVEILLKTLAEVGWNDADPSDPVVQRHALISGVNNLFDRIIKSHETLSVTDEDWIIKAMEDPVVAAHVISYLQANQTLMDARGQEILRLLDRFAPFCTPLTGYAAAIEVDKEKWIASAQLN